MSVAHTLANNLRGVGGGKCTLSFDSGVTIEVTNKTTPEIILELGHYGWKLIKIEKNKTKKSLFFERYIK